MSVFERIPAELRALPQWSTGGTRPVTGSRRRFPIGRQSLPSERAQPTLARPATFEQAVAASNQTVGIGFVFTANDPYCGVDLDLELPEADRASSALALGSYTEASVSGGWHVIVRASLNGGRHPQGLGLFDRGRYFVMTGRHVAGTPTTVEERQAELEAVLAEYLPKRGEPMTSAPAQPVDLDDQELLEVAFTLLGAKFKALWEGAWQGRYETQSQADLALCSFLAWLTGRDAGRIERMFRSGGLYREGKWDRQDGEGRFDYRERTIEKAIVGTAETYQPSARNVGGAAKALKPLSLEERGVPSDFPGEHSSCGLQDVLDVFGELLVMPDPGAVEIALASVVANYAPGDVVWPLLVGPPGCGKSEIVSALRRAPDVWPLSSLTPQTLLSGFERKGKDASKPASMLLQIGSFGILAFKDLTTVLTMHREARAQIIGQLREVADGRTEKSFGNGLRIEWEGKLGLIAGVTPVIDEQHAFLAVMGERFLLYRLPEVTRKAIARRSLERRGHEDELRERIGTMVAGFLGGFRNVGRLDLPDHFTEPLITLADIVTRARSAVARDYQTRDILYLPEPEAPTRLAKQIAQLMAASLAIGVDETEAWRLAQKIGWDSVPAVRSAVIRLLARQEGNELTRAELQEKTGLPETTVRRVTEDLVVLGLARQRKDSSGKWLIAQSPLAGTYWDDRE